MRLEVNHVMPFALNHVSDKKNTTGGLVSELDRVSYMLIYLSLPRIAFSSCVRTAHGFYVIGASLEQGSPSCF